MYESYFFSFIVYILQHQPHCINYPLFPMINAFLKKVYFHNTSLQAYFVEAGTRYKQIKNSTLFQRFEMLRSIYVEKSAVLFSYLRFFSENRLPRSFEILIYFSITLQLDWNAVEYITSKHNII